MSLGRRRFIQNVATAALAAPFLKACASDAEVPPPPLDLARFPHGVASGDPLSDAVILWTRLSGEVADGSEVAWWVSTDPQMRRIAASGTALVEAEFDYTVKVDVVGLLPGQTYYYRFDFEGTRSPVGRTRTLPAADASLEQMRFTVACCQNYTDGYFHAYRHMAQRNDIDFVVHVGDYIYEYGNTDWSSDTDSGRAHVPDKEIVSLADYRTRYGQYRLDPDLQEAHRQYAFVAIWDDHEFANNAYNDGAANHNPDDGEGSWAERRFAAIRAYLEWMPIREPSVDARTSMEVPKLYRAVQAGDLFEMQVLDTRMYGREMPLAEAMVQDMPNLSLVGDEQEAWLFDRLENNGARWNILAQQTMFGQFNNPLTGEIANADQWDGYPAARTRVMDAIRTHTLGRTIVLTGDLHISFAADVHPDPFSAESDYDPNTGNASVAVEMMTPAIGSEPGGVTISRTAGVDREQILATVEGTHPHVQHVNLFNNGYLLIDVTRERVQGEWQYFEDASKAETAALSPVSMKVNHGTPHALPGDAPTVVARGKDEPAPDLL